MDVILHYEKEFVRLLGKATERDIIAIKHSLAAIDHRGLTGSDCKTIRTEKPLRELRIRADNKYRIFFTVSGDSMHCWSYAKKTSEAEQEKAIRRAAKRMT